MVPPEERRHPTVRPPSIPHVTTDDDASPDTPWNEWPVGCRVVVRRRLAEGGYSDVLGDLITNTADGVRVLTRRGEVAVPAADIAIGKRVPPAPPRRPAREPD